MRKLWEFHGGIHPPENKSQSNQTAIQKLPLAEEFTLPLSQHIGAAAEPVVIVGQRVLKGEIIAEAEGQISAPVHAPTSGTITAIEDRPVPHPSGMTDTCIIVEADGKDQWVVLEGCKDYKTLSKKEILQRVRQAGIVGMGGAGFPTEVKLHPPPNDKVNFLILNGAECEPYITADDLLMQERAVEIIKGMEIMAYVLEPEEAIIGIEDNKPKAIEALCEAAANTRVEIVVVPTKYPSGGEKQLIKILTGREVPHGHIPADIGVMCQNVATAAAVYRAIRYGEPLISRITTVVGEAVPRAGNYDVLLGTPIAFLLETAGLSLTLGYSEDDARSKNQPTKPAMKRLIMGGPMMGFSLSDVHLPVIKTTNCLLAASASEFPDPAPEQACIRCSMCADVCPAELLPQQLYWYARAEEFDKTEMYNLFDCIECGACSYVCPSHIPLVQYYRFAKHHIRVARAEQEKSDLARERFEFRQQRLEREKQEKAAKRKARAEAAAKAQAAKKAKELLQEDQPAQPQTASESNVANIADTKPPVAPATSTEHTDTNEEVAKAIQNTPLPSLEELQANVDKARNKLQKVEANLVEAESNNNPMAEKLRNAVSKSQHRLSLAEDALAKAKASQIQEQTG